jgi:6-pyruvoyl-tetrahydropterin synthase
LEQEVSTRFEAAHSLPQVNELVQIHQHVHESRNAVLFCVI